MQDRNYMTKLLIKVASWEVMPTCRAIDELAYGKKHCLNNICELCQMRQMYKSLKYGEYVL